MKTIMDNFKKSKLPRPQHPIYTCNVDDPMLASSIILSGYAGSRFTAVEVKLDWMKRGKLTCRNIHFLLFVRLLKLKL